MTIIFNKDIRLIESVREKQHLFVHGGTYIRPIRLKLTAGSEASSNSLVKPPYSHTKGSSAGFTASSFRALLCLSLIDRAEQGTDRIADDPERALHDRSAQSDQRISYAHNDPHIHPRSQG